MAKADKSQKTEKPTPRRRSEARRQGQVAKTPEVAIAVSLLGGAVLARVLLPGITATFADTTTATLGRADEGLAMADLRDHVLRLLGVGIIPFAAVAVVTAVLSNVVQVGFHVAPVAARPKLSNLDPRKGLERLKPSVATWELVKNLGKLGLLVAVVWGPIRSWQREFTEPHGLAEWVSLTAGMAWTVLLRAGVLALVIAAADFLFVLARHRKTLRMSRQEIRDEFRMQEGDPAIRGQRRQRARELSRNRMLGEVATADVVVTNPTHVAVALRYEPGDVAPRVVAKGVDSLALKIRKLAWRNGVMVREDPPLARTLYRTTRVGHLIPASLYEAVAVVIAAAYRRRGRRAG